MNKSTFTSRHPLHRTAPNYTTSANEAVHRAPRKDAQGRTKATRRRITLRGSFVRRKDVVGFIRSLAVLVEARFPVADAVASLSSQRNRNKLDTVIDQVAAAIRAGGGLADGLSAYPAIFPLHYVELIRVGEATGQLATILNRLATDEERTLHLRRQVRSALTYPILVLTVTLGTTVFLLTAIVPRFAELFASFDAELPGPTQIVVSASQLLTHHWLPAVLVAAVVIVGAGMGYRTPSIRTLVHRLLLRLPLVGNVVRKSVLGNYCRTLSMLTSSGVPIDQALALSSSCSRNDYFRSKLEVLPAHIRRGESLSTSWRDTRMFEDLALNLMSAGEKSGELSLTLDHVSDYYVREVESSTEALASLIEPILIVIVGGLLGGLLSALYLPLFDIVNVIQ